MDSAKQLSLSHKVFAVVVALLLALSLSPFQALSAYADQAQDEKTENAASAQEVQDDLSSDALELATQQSVEVQAAPQAAGEVMGGSNVTSSGSYNIASGATGAITIGEGLDVTLVGKGIASGSAYTDLSIVVGNDSKLTLQNVYITSSDMTMDSPIDFSGKGELAIEGENIIERANGSESANPGTFPAIIHVGTGSDVTFSGSGILYGYKQSIGAFIGGSSTQTSDAPCGDITFKSGTWCIKGSKTGALIGGENANGDCGTIKIEGGALYLKAVARGSAIGCSAKGKAAPKVEISGGQVEIVCDFSASAIGCGGASAATDASEVVMTGGSLKTICTSNGYSSWGITSEANAVVTSKTVTAQMKDGQGNNLALGIFDASKYPDMQYRYVANEAKNLGSYTPNNWVANTAENTWDGSNGSTFAPDANLYFWLPQAGGVIEVGGDQYSYAYNSETGLLDFSPYSSSSKADTSWYNTTSTEFSLFDAADLAGLAAIVNGTASGIAQDDFAGKTVVLAQDIQLADSDFASWEPIGNEDAAFAGMFDGQGYAIDGLGVDSDAGYVGLFGNVAAAGKVKDFTLSGSVKTTASSDYAGGVAGYNAGTISGVTSSVAVLAENAYNVGGIAGFNDGGYNAQISTTAPTGGTGIIEQCGVTDMASVTGYQKVGGIAGENAGSVDQCYALCTVVGKNASSKNGVGGIVGRNGNNNAALEEGTVSQCYFRGTVGSAGQKWVGGIAGLNNAKSSVTGCYMAGTLVAGAGYYNAIVGNQEGAASGNYALPMTTSGKTEAEIGIVKTEAEMKALPMISLLGPSFTVDVDGTNDDYPILTWQSSYLMPLSATIYGDTRYETAVAAAYEAYPSGAEGVIVASGLNFPDALSASSLAGALDYPILLISDDSVDVVLDAVDALAAKQAIVVGGNAAVSDAAYAALEGALGAENVDRIAGDTRYDTQMCIYNYGNQKNLWESDPIVATGNNFADALSISSYAAWAKAPIFLADAETGLASDARDALFYNYAGKNVVIVGGSAAVSEAAEADIARLTGAEPIRLQGGVQQNGMVYDDFRYGTSAAIADFCVSAGMTVTVVGFATGTNFPDALAAGPVQAKSGSTVLLISPDYLDSAATMLSQDKNSISLAMFFGGSAAISPETQFELLEKIAH